MEDIAGRDRRWACQDVRSDVEEKIRSTDKIKITPRSRYRSRGHADPLYALSSGALDGVCLSQKTSTISPELVIGQEKVLPADILHLKMPREKKDESNELSEFEKQRLANIAERDALLKKLTLEAQSSGLFSKPSPKSSSGDSSKPKKKASAKKVKQENEPPVPRRMSSRLRGITADSELAKRKADEEYEAAQRAEQAKRMRKSDSYTLNDMLVSGQKLNGDSLIGVDVVTKGVAKPYERTFGEEDIKKTTDKDLKALREQMSGLQLWGPWEPNRMILAAVLYTIFGMSFNMTTRYKNHT